MCGYVKLIENCCVIVLWAGYTDCQLYFILFPCLLGNVWEPYSQVWFLLCRSTEVACICWCCTAFKKQLFVVTDRYSYMVCKQDNAVLVTVMNKSYPDPLTLLPSNFCQRKPNITAPVFLLSLVFWQSGFLLQLVFFDKLCDLKQGFWMSICPVLSFELSFRNSEIMIINDSFMKLCIVIIALGSEIILGSTFVWVLSVKCML